MLLLTSKSILQPNTITAKTGTSHISCNIPLLEKENLIVYKTFLTYLGCIQMCLYLLWISRERSSLQNPRLLKTINNCWCGWVILPGRGSKELSSKSWVYPFWKDEFSLFDIFWPSSLPICSKWPNYMHQIDGSWVNRIQAHKTSVNGPLHTSKIKQTVQKWNPNSFLSFSK